MGKGPALAAAPAGPALLAAEHAGDPPGPGHPQDRHYVALVVLMATLTGWLFGQLAD